MNSPFVQALADYLVDHMDKYTYVNHYDRVSIVQDYLEKTLTNFFNGDKDSDTTD